MEKELNPCLIIFELMGMQYFSLKHSNRNNFSNRPTNYRRAHMLIMSLFLSLFVASFILTVDVIEIDKVTPKRILMFAIQSYLKFGLIFVVFIGAIQSYASTKNFKRFFMNLKEIANLSFREFNLDIDFKLLKKESLRRTAIVLICFFSSHSVVCYLTFVAEGKVFDYSEFTIATTLVVFIVMITYKFVFYVCMINYQLMFLNKILGKIFKQEHVAVVNNINFQLLTNTETSTRKILQARIIFKKIYENSCLINKSIGLTFLILLINTVVALTSAGYEAFKIIVKGIEAERTAGLC